MLETWKNTERNAVDDRSDFWTSLEQENSINRWPAGAMFHADLRGVEAEVTLRSLWASQLGCPDQDIQQAGVSQ